MLKNLILGLAMSTSAAASAAPCNDAPATTSSSRPVHEEPAYEVARTNLVEYKPIERPMPPQPAPAASWVNLSGGLRLDGTANVYVGKNKGEFRALELVSGWGNGSTKVKSLTITFGNGEKQIVTLNTTLGPSNRTASIDLAGKERFIKSISINGFSRGRSQVEIRAI